MTEKEFHESPNIKNFLWRLPELWTDPASNQLSASRMVLFMCGCCMVSLTWAAILGGKISEVTTLVAAVAATSAGVYFGSTIKDWRWKRRDSEKTE